MINVANIPKFFRPPNYSIHMDWDGLEINLERWAEEQKAMGFQLILDPDFQRGHVWTEDKQIAFVEFCLMEGTGSRTILWNHPGWQSNFKGDMLLVDGKQRLEAVRRFVRNDLAIFGGNRLSDFDKPNRLLRTNGAHFVFSVNNLRTRKEVLEWYLQINSGGVVHTPEEIQKVKDLLAKESNWQIGSLKFTVTP